MIEVKRPGIRHSGFSGHGTTIAKGRFMYKSGAFVANDYPPSTFGNASVGSAPKMLPATQHIHSGYGVFPVDKLIFATEGANQNLDTIASGTSLIYYEGGEYETDEYDITVSGTGAAPGDRLWLNSSGQISLLAGAGTGPTAGWQLPPIGEIVKISSFPATNAWYNGGNTSGVDSYKKTVWFRLYPNHAHPAGKPGNPITTGV